MTSTNVLNKDKKEYQKIDKDNGVFLLVKKTTTLYSNVKIRVQQHHLRMK